MRWWNDNHGEPAPAVTAEMRSAHTREVVNPELIARFDASLAELLLPPEWAHISSRLYPAQHDHGPSSSDDEQNG